MKLAVFGDIHGNATALRAVLADMADQGVDARVCLGDIAFKGPQPEESVETLFSTPLDAIVRGNGDELLTQGFPPNFNPPAAKKDLLDAFHAWALQRLSAASMERLRSLPFQHTQRLGPHTMAFVHAGPRSTTDYYPATADIDALLPIFAGVGPCDMLVYGHIHTPFVRRLNRRWLVNTGSVGFPVDGDYRASYALFDASNGGLNISIRRVAYDVRATLQAAIDADMPYREKYSECLRAGHAF